MPFESFNDLGAGFDIGSAYGEPSIGEGREGYRRCGGTLDVQLFRKSANALLAIPLSVVLRLFFFVCHPPARWRSISRSIGDATSTRPLW